MIATKVAARRQELETQLSQLLEMNGNSTRRGRGKMRTKPATPTATATATATADEVRRVLLEAKYISFPDAAAGAAAGVSFEEMRKLGITEAMKPKIKPAQGGRGAMALLPRVTSIST
jgi:hypothetical protein